MAQAGTTFRVFVSSTFSDLKAERDALQRRVFPRLRDLCMAHGARFQAIDLRWGVSEEAALDQQTMNLCLAEIHRCQKVTPHPNFIVLLGERYGWRPLPPQVEKGEFEALLAQTKVGDRDFLLAWYRLDENAVPPEYCLQPRSGESAGAGVWAGIETRLHAVLSAAAKGAGLSSDALARYEASATEQEIGEGALKAGTGHAFCYFRTIDKLPPAAASGFLDQDADSRARLEGLKARLRTHLDADHIHDFRVEWRDGLEEEQLAEFCACVEADLSRAILEELGEIEAVSELDGEVEAHRVFGEERAKHFLGRQAEMRRIGAYLEGDETWPLVVCGPSGCGKSALTARVTQLVRDERPEALCVYRFIGATPASTDLRSLLSSLCRQLGAEGELPPDVRELAAALQERLAAAAEARPVVVFLDALDQLSPTDNAHSLTWLPSELPANVRLVVSALEREDEAGACLRAARQKLAAESFVQVPPLAPEEGEQLLDIWLGEAGRTLQPEQKADVLAKFAGCPQPLFLRLAFEEVRPWKSYEGVLPGADEAPGIGVDVRGVIEDLLARLEAPANHGPVMVRKALGYLAAARNGLSEDEMLDVVSADDEVWEAVVAGARHELPERRLPVVIWSRLFLDLEPYLTERAADGTSLMAFYHRQVGEVVTARYVTSDAHQGLAEYFAAQPLTNVRKLSELPFQQTHGELWDGLKATLTDLLFLEAKCEAGMTYDLVADYNGAANLQPIEPYGQFIRASAHIFAQGQEWLLQRAYNSAASGPVPDQAERLLAGSTRPWLRRLNRPADGPTACLAVLEGHTDVLTGLAVAADGSQAVTTSDDRTARVWDLATGRCLRVLEAHTDALCAVALTSKDEQAVTAAGDRTLRLWDLASGQCLRVFTGHTAPVMAVAATRDGVRAVSGGAEGAVRVWDLATGECLRVMTRHNGAIFAVALTPDGRRAFTGGYDGIARVWDLASGDCLQTLRGHKGTIEGIAVTSDGTRLVTAGGWRHPVKGAKPVGETIGFWDLATGECVSMLEPPAGQVTSAAVTRDGTRALTGHGDRALRIWDLASGDCVGILEGHARGVVRVAVAADDTRAVTIAGYDDHTIRVWDLTAALPGAVSERRDTSVRTVAAALDGSLAVTGALVGTIRLWDMSSGACLRTLQGQKAGDVGFLAVTPDAARAVTATMGDSARLWDLASGQCLRSLDAYVWGLESAAMTPDGGRLVAGGYDGSIRAWDLTTGECSVIARWEGGSAKPVAVSSDGELVLTMANWGKMEAWDKSVAVWSVTTGECVQVLAGHTDSVTAFVLTPDARRAVTASADGTLRVWDLSTGRCLRVLEGYRRGPEVVQALAATADGESVVGTCANGRVSVWDLATGERREAFTEGTRHICLFALSPNGRHVVFGGWDKTIRVWDLDSGREIARLRAAAVADPCAVGPRNALVAGDRAGNVYLMQLENVEAGPDVLTAWRSPVDGSFAFGCTHCRAWSEVPTSALGTELPCPHCGKPVKLNAFTIDADWRPIARAWRGDDEPEVQP